MGNRGNGGLRRRRNGWTDIPQARGAAPSRMDCETAAGRPCRSEPPGRSRSPPPSSAAARCAEPPAGAGAGAGGQAAGLGSPAGAFQERCAGCHGEAATGTTRHLNLLERVQTLARAASSAACCIATTGASPAAQAAARARRARRWSRRSCSAARAAPSRCRPGRASRVRRRTLPTSMPGCRRAPRARRAPGWPTLPQPLQLDTLEARGRLSRARRRRQTGGRQPQALHNHHHSRQHVAFASATRHAGRHPRSQRRAASSRPPTSPTCRHQPWARNQPVSAELQRKLLDRHSCASRWRPAQESRGRRSPSAPGGALAELAERAGPTPGARRCARAGPSAAARGDAPRTCTSVAQLLLSVAQAARAGELRPRGWRR